MTVKESICIILTYESTSVASSQSGSKPIFDADICYHKTHSVIITSDHTIDNENE